MRWPQLGYPGSGVVQCCTLAGLVIIAALPRKGEPGSNSAAWLGAAFFIYLVVRWLAAGAPSVGNDGFGTLSQATAWAAVSYWLRSSAEGDLRRRMDFALLRIIALVALACGIHAFAQYFWIYDRAYAALQESIGTAQPTPLQVGLLHHFQLRRVASVWGDPNILAGFCAMSLAASGTLASGLFSRGDGEPAKRVRIFDGVLGISAIAAAAVAIILSGSRGGMLEAVVLIAVALIWVVMRRRSPRHNAGVAILFVCTLLVTTPGVPQPPESHTQSAWTWRSNTIAERANYFHVGAAMFQESPVFGLGVGSVDLYFGRFKPPQARESKYLHNWVLQLLAETGLVGFLLGSAFLVALFWNGARRSELRSPGTRAVWIIGALFVLDALVQLSFNHREMMALFGICAGVLLANGSRPKAGRWVAELRWGFAGALVLAMAIFVMPALKALHYRQQATDMIEQGRAAETEHLLRTAQNWEPRNPVNYLRLAQSKEAAGQLSSARLLVEEALKRQPESAAAHAALATVQQKLGEWKAAESELQEALQRYPANAAYNGQMAQLLVQRGRKAEALKYARKAAEFSPGVAGAEHWPAFYEALKSSK
ncbi:MAG: O-antigen ligase family protein [Candidatus Sumerlaeaceae bacterium]